MEPRQHNPRILSPTLPESRIMPEEWLGPLDLDAFWEQDGPLAVDLGCGKGNFLLTRAGRFPGIRYLGIERKLRRIRRLEKKIRTRGLLNVRLLRIEGYYGVRYLLPADCVDVFYVFFPDPWPKKRHADNRIFAPPFLEALLRALKPGGEVHFATDQVFYHAEVSALLDADPRLERIEPDVPLEEERSEFERDFMHLRPTQRYSFRLRA